MSYTDKRTIQFVKHRVTGLPFIPSHAERTKYPLRSQEDVEKDVLALWNRYKTSACQVVAYKGGCIEKDILDKLKIPSFNVEAINCHKYDALAKLYGKTFNCNCHLVGDFHCSEDEVYLFMRWYKKHFWLK